MTTKQNSISIAFPDSSGNNYCGTSILDSCLSSGNPIQITSIQFSEDIDARIIASTNNWSPSKSSRIYEWSIPTNKNYQNYILSNVSISTGQPVSFSDVTSSNNTLNIKVSLNETFPETNLLYDPVTGIGWVPNYGLNEPGSNMISLGSFAIYATNWTDPNKTSYLLLCGWYDTSTVQSFSTTSSILGNVLNLNLLLQFTSLSQDIGNITYAVEENPLATIPQTIAVDNLPIAPNVGITTPNSYIVRTSNNLNKPVLAFRDNYAGNNSSLSNIWGFANYHPYTSTSVTDPNHAIYIQSLIMNPYEDSLVFNFNSTNFKCLSLNTNTAFKQLFSTLGKTLDLTGQLLLVLDENNFNNPINKKYIGLSRVVTNITNNNGILSFYLSSAFSNVPETTQIFPTFTLYVRNGINF